VWQRRQYYFDAVGADPHPLTVVAADLKAIGAPAAVARIDGDASVMPLLDAAGMAIKAVGRGPSSPGFR
jgi:hypothetical protein